MSISGASCRLYMYIYTHTHYFTKRSWSLSTFQRWEKLNFEEQTYTQLVRAGLEFKPGFSWLWTLCSPNIYRTLDNHNSFRICVWLWMRTKLRVMVWERRPWICTKFWQSSVTFITINLAEHLIIPKRNTLPISNHSLFFPNPSTLGDQ